MSDVSKTIERLIARVRDPKVCTDDLHRELAKALDHATREPIGDGEYILALIKTIKKTGGSVEIHGVKIMPCDEYGRTGVERDAEVAAKAWDQGNRAGVEHTRSFYLYQQGSLSEDAYSRRVEQGFQNPYRKAVQ